MDIIELSSSLLCLAILHTVYSKQPNATEIRLIGGRGPHEGHIEILLYDQWRHICPNHWDMRDAKVVCRQLNYTKAVTATTKSFLKVNDKDKMKYWLDSVQCWGSEGDVNYCWHRKHGRHNCKDPNRLAGVVCSNVTETERKFPVPSIASGKKGGEMKVRLRGEQIHGFTSNGFLEVLHSGLWRYVCADGWTKKASFVACGHLGYPDVDSDVNQIPVEKPDDLSDYWMSNVQCDGSESTLYECEHSGWKRHVCQQNKAVYLNCKRSPLLLGNRFDKALIMEHTARLRAGSKHSEGRVEVLYANRWGTICDDGWDIKAANIFCRMVGFGTAFEAVHYALFGQGMGKVWLDEVRCNGFERNVTECKHLEWGKGDCGHPEDAGVKCHYPYGKSENPVRVTGGEEKNIGRVEVLSNGMWKGVCGIGFGLNEAQVVCRETGLGFPRRGFATHRFGASKKVAMYTVRCSGDELSLSHCFYNKQNKRSCDRWMAAVNCSKTAPDLVTDYRQVKKTITLQEKSLRSMQCALDEGCLSSAISAYSPGYYYRNLLRFTSRMYNRGTENFLPFKNRAKWEWHECHQHYHSMERFSDYDLTDKNGKKHADGHKASFCLEDSMCDGGVKQYFDCRDNNNQGISVNCADNYKWSVDCQWIDITKAEYGRYKLRIILNPKRKVFESDYTNNIVLCNINYLTRGKVEVEDCYLHTCEQPSHGGTSGGACCKFPFTYKGEEYRTCTTAGFKRHSVLWCATTSNYDDDHLWGHCRPV